MPISNHGQFKESGGGWVAQNGTESCLPHLLGLGCGMGLLCPPPFPPHTHTHELPGKGFQLYLLCSWQRLLRPKRRQPRAWSFQRFGGNSRPELAPFPFPPAQSLPRKELTRALDSGTAGSNKSEACLGASFIKRPNLPRPFRLIADLQKLLRV